MDQNEYSAIVAPTALTGSVTVETPEIHKRTGLLSLVVVKAVAGEVVCYVRIEPSYVEQACQS